MKPSYVGIIIQPNGDKKTLTLTVDLHKHGVADLLVINIINVITMFKASKGKIVDEKRVFDKCYEHWFAVDKGKFSFGSTQEHFFDVANASLIGLSAIVPPYLQIGIEIELLANTLHARSLEKCDLASRCPKIHLENLKAHHKEFKIFIDRTETLLKLTNEGEN